MATIDEIILRHSRRGMPLLAQHLPAGACQRAAEALLACPRGLVTLITGFPVGPAAETDGPPGTYFLGLGLQQLGFQVLVATDRLCRGFFDHEPGLAAEYLPLEREAAVRACQAFLQERNPVALVAVERCGRDATGTYRNMHGHDISSRTAPLDELFLQAAPETLTIGIGDGGNEIGMGGLRDVIRSELKLSPCVVPADHLLVATVSSCGALGLLACLGQLTGRQLLPGATAHRAFLEHIVSRGAVAAPRGEPALEVDGFDLSVELDILESLEEASMTLEPPLDLPPEVHHPGYHIRRMRMPHCARGPERCTACQETPEEVCLLQLHPPGSGLAARPIIQVGDDPRWWEYEILGTFDSQAEAESYLHQLPGTS